MTHYQRMLERIGIKGIFQQCIKVCCNDQPVFGVGQDHRQRKISITWVLSFHLLFQICVCHIGLSGKAQIKKSKIVIIFQNVTIFKKEKIVLILQP